MPLDNLGKYYLQPSTIFVDTDPYWITTVLGSCVAICFYDKRLKYGGMNHYMLPFWNGEGLESPKYGNVAIPTLYQKMLDFGSKKDDIVCKIFGGGEVLTKEQSVFYIGQRNIEVAYKTIWKLGLHIAGSSTGGHYGRKIVFNSTTGVVLQKYLTKSI